MSAPNTDIKKQERRHPALRIMILCGIFVAVLAIGYTVYVAASGNEPRDATKIDGRTGEVEPSTGEDPAQ